MQSSSSQINYPTPTSDKQYVTPQEISDLAEQKLMELVRQGNLEAIKLAISLRPQSYDVTC